MSNLGTVIVYATVDVGMQLKIAMMVKYSRLL
jgi:hypothetical protein